MPARKTPPDPHFPDDASGNFGQRTKARDGRESVDGGAGLNQNVAHHVTPGNVSCFADRAKPVQRIFAASVNPVGELYDKCELFRTPRGFGPRHLTALGDGMVVNGELSSGLVALCKNDAAFMPLGSLRTDPSNKPDNLDGHLLVEDELIWTSNRGADTLVAFRMVHGRLHQVRCFASGGQSPRHFAKVNKHLVVAHEKNGLVASIDPREGKVVSGVAVPGAAFIMST
ncbi:beta-propeller fold lactonase family protein [Novosphingobium jiangmenense]|uniref:Beta-propeller fold lactonase family protein n=1 Tax=Novosphingobium jiangmenense TaxID=2791981 RepID=A0ABS0HLN1_9SPHN|nr:beta-propeller fold lactonase family protein [Novosphingobium jiangmenense]MBF9153152.1 beta-propeller fold lactonase family protein [Novosphingobium jiangmenense]